MVKVSWLAASLSKGLFGCWRRLCSMERSSSQRYPVLAWVGGKWRHGLIYSDLEEVWGVESRERGLVTWWLKLDFRRISVLHRHYFETMSTPTNSPDHTPIQPLHNPSLAAQVVVSQALINNGSIAPLAKKGWVLRGYACRNDADGRQATLHLLALLQTTS